MVWYIGITRKGVGWRLFKHIRGGNSEIGREMRDIFSGPTVRTNVTSAVYVYDVKVFDIDGDLEAAEKALINTYQPFCNKVYCEEPGRYLSIDDNFSTVEDDDLKVCMHYE